MFPNITHVEATKDRNEPLPIFNIALFILLGMLAVTIAIKLLRLGKKKALREQL